MRDGLLFMIALSLCLGCYFAFVEHDAFFTCISVTAAVMNLFCFVHKEKGSVR